MSTTAAPLSRRSFLLGTGGVAIGLSFGLGQAELAQAQTAAPGGFAPNGWVNIDTDGQVTLYSPASEMGQGTMTAIPMLLAEEMDLDWSRVTVLQAPSDPKRFGNPRFGGGMTTGASRTVQGYYEPVRLAGLQARLVLVNAAAQAMGVPAAELRTEAGRVVHTSGRQMGYGDIAKVAQVPAELPKVDKAMLKPMAQFKLIGKDLDRVDVAAKSNGSAQYGIDVRLPGMLWASILRAPVQGETPVSVDDAAARAVPGVKHVVRLPHGVAVVADSFHTAKTARDRLQVEWTQTAKARAHDSARVKAEYRGPRPEARRRRGGLHPARRRRAAAGRRGENLRRHLHQRDGQPHLPGADELHRPRHRRPHRGLGAGAVGLFRDRRGGGGQRLQAGADQGQHHPAGRRFWPPGRGGLRGRRRAGGQGRARHAGAGDLDPRRRHDPRQVPPADRPAPGGRRGRAGQAGGPAAPGRVRRHLRAVVPPAFKASGGKDAPVMEGSEITYDIPGHRVQFMIEERGIQAGFWRGVGPGYTKFAIETLVDEVAHGVKADPLEYRVQLLHKQPRAQAVLREVGRMSGWGKAKLPKGHALGLAFSDAWNTFCGMVVQVSIEQGRPKVHKVWSAVDCGHALQPRNVRAQIEGSVIFGLSALLHERMDFQGGVPQQTNLDRLPRAARQRNPAGGSERC